MLAESHHTNGRDDATEASDSSRLGAIMVQFDEDYCSDDYLDQIAAGRFSFNGEAHDLGRDFDWLDNPSTDIEWHILLHKFYYAPGLARAYVARQEVSYRDCFINLIERWIEQVPISFIAPDVTARRVQNWIYAWTLFKTNGATLEPKFETLFIESIAAQVDFLTNHLAPARNHRTLGLYAIFLAGVAFVDLPRAKFWREFATRELIVNIESDLLADGVHCELSTDYHHIVLRSYLLFASLARMNGISIPLATEQRIIDALEFAMHIHRPDGKIPALSDSDSGDYRELLSYGNCLFDRPDFVFVATGGNKGTPPEQDCRTFSASGYTILRSPWDSPEPYADARYLVFDSGEIGAGNHGHLDPLNIEIAAYGRPLIVDPGRYTYHEGGDYNWRAHFRESRAHNTITVDNNDQAIYQQRGARRKILKPRPHTELVASKLAGSLPYVHGCVSSPNYDAVHQREIWFPAHRYWMILDRLESTQTHDYELRFQLTPMAAGKIYQYRHSGAIELHTPGLLLMVLANSASVSLEEGFVSNTYGEKFAAPRICFRATANEQCFLTLLYPFRQVPPTVSVIENPTQQTLTINADNRRDSWTMHHTPMQLSGLAGDGNWSLPIETQNV